MGIRTNLAHKHSNFLIYRLDWADGTISISSELSGPTLFSFRVFVGEFIYVSCAPEKRITKPTNGDTRLWWSKKRRYHHVLRLFFLPWRSNLGCQNDVYGSDRVCITQCKIAKGGLWISIKLEAESGDGQCESGSMYRLWSRTQWKHYIFTNEPESQFTSVVVATFYSSLWYL